MEKFKRWISNPINHKYWDSAFSKALTMPKLQYEEGKTMSEMTISVQEQRHKVLKNLLFKIEVEHQDIDQSSFNIYELIGD